MAADVIPERGNAVARYRGTQWLCVAFLPITFGCTVLPMPIFVEDPEQALVVEDPARIELGYISDFWQVNVFWIIVRLAWLALTLVLVREIVRLRRPIEAPRLEIGTDAIRLSWPYRPTRIVPRAAVRAVRYGRHSLQFKPMIGERIPELPTGAFKKDMVIDALIRHQWTLVDRF